RPKWLDGVLERGLPPASRADVLEHTQVAVGPQDALDLAEPAVGLGHAAKHEARNDRVERPVTEGQRLDASLHQRHTGHAPPGADERVPLRLETDDADAGPILRKSAPGSAPDVECEAARAARQPLAP